MKPNQADWEKEFYDKFSFIQAIKNEKSGNSYTRVVDYIRSLLTSERAKAYQEGLHKGREEESIGCLEHSKEEVRKVVDRVLSSFRNLKTRYSSGEFKHIEVYRDEVLEIIRKYKK